MELLPLLCFLGVCCSLALGSDVKAFAPEDLDGSGDDEDFSGSGIEDSDFKTQDEDILSTSVSLLIPTVTQMSTALPPDAVIEEEIEHTTNLMETTKPHDIFDDLFAVEEPSNEDDTSLKPSTQQPFYVATTLQPSTQQPLAEESGYAEEKKHHHHHHHHHHPHNATTTPISTTSEDSFAIDPLVEEPPAEDATIRPTPQQASTEGLVDFEKKLHHHPHHHTTTAVLDIDEETTTSPEAEKPFVVPGGPTTSSPDEESEVDEVDQQVTPTEDLVNHGHHQEAASGTSSTPYADEDTTTLQPNLDDLPIFVDSEEKTTVVDETFHHHPPHTASTPFNGYDIEEIGNDELDQHEQTTKVPVENGHDHRHHPTPQATNSTLSENDLNVHTHEPKGRRVNVPHVETTTAVPVNEDERFPEGMDPVDSSEGASGDAEPDDFFIDGTVPVLRFDDKVGAVPDEGTPEDKGTPEDEGTPDASHGIMDRKELLAGIIAGGLAGLAFAAALVAFVFYRMKKKDEGSYSLEEPKQSNGGYQKPREQREFYA
ncbi:syndecan-1 [Gastrophryne carolinensis]